VPALDVAALRKQANAGKLAPVYLFVGEDIHLAERMLDAIEATVDEADRPFAVERLFAGEASGTPVAIAAAARVYPMLGDRRIVFVLRAERLLKPKRAIKPGEIEPAEEVVQPDEPGIDFTPLEEYLTAPSPSTSLVFVATEIDRTRRFTKKLWERAQVVEFGGFGGGPPGRPDPRAEAVRFVNDELARAGRTIDTAALGALVDRSGYDITRLRGDLERLLLYTQGQSRISRDDVLEVVSSGTTVQDDWAVVNAISDGDAARALVEVGARLDRGDSPHMLVGQLRWWVSSKLADADPERVRPAIDALFRTDLALKSSGGDERVLIERLIVELTGKRLMRRW
jgi:DNA polymerase III delta subunit